MPPKKHILVLFIICTFLFTDLAAHLRIGVMTSSSYVGDREVAWRIKLAGERLGWTVILDETYGHHVSTLQDLDWVISLLPNNDVFNPYCPNYQMIFHPFWYLDDQRRLYPFYEKYDGYLLTIHDRHTIEEGLKAVNKEFHYIPFYPTVHPVEWCEVPLNNLVVMIPVWGNRISDEKFRTLYRLLSESEWTKFYGVHAHSDIVSQGYMGSIPFDGASVINVLQQHGIVLIMHSEIHNRESIPSARIFEAAAASAVIISDHNAFVKQHFGESVFYIDTEVSAQEIYAQIVEHMSNILHYPKEAREMAQKAHQIFIEHFTMTEQLLRLEALNQKVLSKRALFTSSHRISVRREAPDGAAGNEGIAPGIAEEEPDASDGCLAADRNSVRKSD